MTGLDGWEDISTEPEPQEAPTPIEARYVLFSGGRGPVEEPTGAPGSDETVMNIYVDMTDVVTALEVREERFSIKANAQSKLMRFLASAKEAAEAAGAPIPETLRQLIGMVCLVEWEVLPIDIAAGRYWQLPQVRKVFWSPDDGEYDPTKPDATQPMKAIALALADAEASGADMPKAEAKAKPDSKAPTVDDVVKMIEKAIDADTRNNLDKDTLLVVAQARVTGVSDKLLEEAVAKIKA